MAHEQNVIRILRATRIARVAGSRVALVAAVPLAIVWRFPPGPAGWMVPVAVERLFESDSVLAMTLRADYKSLLRERDSTRARDHPATLAYVDSGGDTVALGVQLRIRGHWRRAARNCAFTPLRVTFPKGGLSRTVFAGQKRLKLVTHCQTGDEWEQYVLREYLLYRAFGLLTPRNFRVRLARVTYSDGSGREVATRYAFFVEDDDDVARRNGAKVLVAKGGRYDDFDPVETALVTAFEYMIGNTDWSISGLHNIVLLRDTVALPVPVPYDFDFSGAVGTRYSAPDARLPIRSVRQRLFRGNCLTPEQWAPVLARFAEKRAAIYALYDSLPALDRRYARDVRSYFDEFYAVIADRRAVKRELVDPCQPGA